MFGRTIFGAVSLSALAFAITLALGATLATPARAQLVAADPSTNSVLVDLGAIDGGAPVISGRGRSGGGSTGVGTGILGTMPSGNGQLLLPPQSAPSSRLMGPDGRALRQAALPGEPGEERIVPRAPRASAAPKAAKAAPAPQSTRTANNAPQARPEARPELTRPEPAKSEPTRPSLPPVALPSMPAPTAPKDGGPIALNSPTPPPTVAPAPPPNIPSMTLVGPDATPNATPGPQASVTPPTSPAPAAQPKAAPTQLQAQPQAKAPPASKGPTPAPTVAPPASADAPSAAPSTPPSSSAPKSAPKADQLAALPPATKGATKGSTPQGMEILFAVGTSDLSNEAKAALDKLTENLKGDEKSRLQLLAYANEDQASPSKSRRLSLSRALAVRSHLIAKGIRSTRIDVRALGDQIPSGEPNRVDLQITDR